MDTSPPVSIPRLHTERLTLREYRAEDFDAHAVHLADPVATAFLGACDRHTAWRIFGCQVGAWVLHGSGWWTVERRETQEVVGSVGAFIREGFDGIEVGWNTYRAFWGQGFASEAGAAAIRFAFEVRGEARVKAFIDPRNAPSIRVASRLGLRHEADTDFYGKPVGLYTRERDAAF